MLVYDILFLNKIALYEIFSPLIGFELSSEGLKASTQRIDHHLGTQFVVSPLIT